MLNNKNIKTMTENNKKTLINFLKVLVLILLVGCAIIPNVEIWNLASEGNTDGFHVLFSILNLIGCFVGIYFVGKAMNLRDLFKQNNK